MYLKSREARNDQSSKRNLSVFQTVWIHIRSGVLYLGLKCLQRLSAGDTSRQRIRRHVRRAVTVVKQSVKSNQFVIHAVITN